MSEQIVIQTENLAKRYGKFVAVDHLNLAIQRGEVYGLLGPNGSGKTTTILMLLGLTEPTTGRVEVLGLDPMRQPLTVKARVGYLPDSVGFYDNLTAQENLVYIAKLNGLKRTEADERINAAIDRMGLTEAAHNRVGTFSRGMRQRLGVAELLLKQPEIIIMDEPTLGLDPDAAHKFLRTILDLRSEGITVMLSSHLLHQVQEVCDRVGLFNRGKIVLEGSVHDLAMRVLGGAYRIKLELEGDPESLEKALFEVPGALSVHAEKNGEFGDRDRVRFAGRVASAAIAAGGRLKSLNVEVPSLDEIYAQYFEEVEHVAVA